MNTITPEQDPLTPLISTYLDIQEITWGNARLNFIVRYRGQLKKDSEEAYTELSAALKAHKITPLFRQENDTHAIILIEGIPESKPSNPWINLALFLFTLVSVLMSGVFYAYDGPLEPGLMGFFRTFWENLPLGYSFGFSMIAILLAHEFGHYLAARYHKTHVTLPYFLPLPPPLSPFGTLGAFIQLKEPPRNKRVLHDIGIAGPLAGLMVSIPVLLIGLSLSNVDTLPRFIETGQAISLEGNSLFYLFSKYVVHGEWLPAPVSYGSMSPLVYWARYILTGLPTPLGGRDVLLHPMAWAGWAGLLVTGLNLIPVGQLDGGHLLYVLFGDYAERAIPFLLIGLGLLGFAWPGWWIWVLLIFFMGRRHAEPLDQITELDSSRMALAIFTLVVFILIFMPVPLRLIIGPYVGP